MRTWNINSNDTQNTVKESRMELWFYLNENTQENGCQTTDDKTCETYRLPTIYPLLCYRYYQQIYQLLIQPN